MAQADLIAAQNEAMFKWMQHVFNARNGLLAAWLAQAGYTGIKRVFEREYGGLLSTFCEGHEPAALQACSELGERWMTTSIIIEAYAAVSGLHSLLDGMFGITADRSLQADEIEHNDIDLSHAVHHRGWWKLQRPITPTAAQMDVAYALAVGLFDGAALIPQIPPQRIEQDDVRALTPRIGAYYDPAFDSRQTRGKSRLGRRLKDGTHLENAQLASRSCLRRSPTAGITAKISGLANGLIANASRSAIVDAVPGPERLTDLRALVQLAEKLAAAFSG